MCEWTSNTFVFSNQIDDDSIPECILCSRSDRTSKYLLSTRNSNHRTCSILLQRSSSRDGNRRCMESEDAKKER